MRLSLTGGVSWRCGNTVETPGKRVRSLTGNDQQFMGAGTREAKKNSAEGATVAPNLDHIALPA